MPHHDKAASSLLCAAILMGCGAAVFAQGSPAPSNPLDQLPLPAAQVPGGGTQLQVAPAPATPQGVLATEITPTRFDVEGVASAPFAEVAAVFAPLIGRKVTVAALVEKAREASAIYERAGWALSFVYIPTQSFAGGAVRVVAVEGFVAQVKVEGDAGRSKERIEAIAAKISGERPLRRATFERYAALLGRLPGLSVQARVPLPASTDGASVMTLQVERKAFEVSIGADLRKPRARAIATATLNDTLTPGGQLAVSALLFGGEERLGAVQYRQAVGTEGLMLKASVSTYRGNPDESLGIDTGFDRRNMNLRRELSMSYPLKLAASSSLMVSGGAYSVDNIDRTTNPATTAYLSDEARVRAVFAQVAWDESLPDRARSVSLMLVRGLSGAGAETVIKSNVPGLAGPGAARVDFTRAVLEAREARRFNAEWGGALSGALQYSPHVLPSTERMSFGGMRFGRGYAPGETSGDQGWGVGAELNRSFGVPGTWVRQIQPYVLVEAARVYAKLGTPMPARLSSVSAGVRLADLKHYSVDVSVAKPTGDRPIENVERKPRFALQVSWRL